MKQAITCFFLIMFILIACQKKSLPVITQRDSSRPLRGNDTTAWVVDVSVGRNVFNNRCGRCHGLPSTDQYTSQKWDTIITLMAPRARLSGEQEFNVRAYVKANASR